MQFQSDENAIVERLREELSKSEPTRKKRIIEKFILAALGSIPWVGGFLSAAASYKAEDDSIKQNILQTHYCIGQLLHILYASQPVRGKRKYEPGHLNRSEPLDLSHII